MHAGAASHESARNPQLQHISHRTSQCRLSYSRRPLHVPHAAAERGIAEPALGGVETTVPKTPFIDANRQTILNGNPNRIGLGDFTRNDGIDGTGLAAYKQFTSLCNHFDFVAFCVPPHDRTWFPGLVEVVEQFLEEQVKGFEPERPVYLLGESFGAVLAIAVAANRPDLVDRIVLVNPATSFDRSVWPVIGPLLPQVPNEFYEAVPIALAPFLGNPLALAAAGVDFSAPLPEQVAALGQGLANMLPQLTALTGILPPPTLDWKLQLLANGCKFIENRYKDVKQRVLVLTGDGDWLIPSAEEGPRLQEVLPRAVLKELPGRSHAMLQEAQVDLVELIKEEGFYVRRRNMSAPVTLRSRETFGTASPIELPTPVEFEKLSDRALGWLRKLVSPVYFSRDADGVVRQGLESIPRDRPILFVGNHQTYALDLGFVVEGLLKEVGILPRGLAHPIIFEGAGDSSFGSFLQTFGAVKVGPTSFFRLLKNGEAVLLYPGGVREAYKLKGEKYNVIWPQEPEFVRMAARFGAVIVPVAAVGVEDSVEMLLDAKELQQLPFVGNRLREGAARIPRARQRNNNGFEEEMFLQPFSVPKVPERFYFLFETPIYTFKEDEHDRERINDIYRQTKAGLESGIDYLLQQRKRDPYGSFPRRVAYETLNRRQAPSFPLPPSSAVPRRHHRQVEASASASAPASAD